MYPEIIAAIFVLVTCICLIRGIYETYILKVSYESLGYENELKKSENKIRVFLFSDLHTSYLNIPASSIVSEINKSDADVVLIAGDMVNKGRTGEISKLKIYIKAICDAARIKNIPICAVYGNHDTKEIIGNLLDADGSDNLQFLSNSSISVKSKYGSIWQITGLEDIKTGNPDYLLAHENLKNAGLPKDVLPEIILAHNPDSIYILPFISNPESENANNKFLLSGHFHGGQIWMPFNLEYKILRKEKMAAAGYRRGSFEYKSLKGYITRGLGCVVVPLRFFSYPEVAVLDLYS